MPTSYETGGPDPGRRPLGPVRAIALPAILLVAGSMVTACGGDDPGSASDAPAASATFHMSAADRDSSLDAIQRWLTAGRADNAIAVARTLAERLPDDPHARLALGRTLLALGSEARIDPGRGPTRARALSAEAVEALRPAYDAWRDGNPRAAEARRSLGLALEGDDRLEEAIEIYAEARLDEDPVSRFHLGLALLRAERADEADIVLSEVETVRPDDAFVVAARAEAARTLGRADEARALADTAVRLDGGSWPIRVQRASILRRIGDPKAAIESLLAMDDSSRLELPVLEEMTEGWLALGRPAAAADQWAELARARRDDPSASLGAAMRASMLYAKAGMDGESDTWIEIGRDLDPRDVRLESTERELESIRAARVRP